jgi:diguanylate cyclase (GGDEF)-like protein/PAS domain S-box-containing protein
MTEVAAASLPAHELRRLLGDVCATLIESRGDALTVQDAASGRFVHASAEMLAWLGLPADAVLGRTSGELFEPPATAALRIAEQAALNHPSALDSEHRFDRHGTRREFAVRRVASQADADGRRWLVSLWRDLAPVRQRDAQLRQALEQIELQQRANEQLRKELSDQGLRDPASGLYSRAHFEDQLRREVDLSTREHREFAIVFIELDPTRDEVRSQGAAGENAILAAMGRLLRGGTRAMDASCRLDERRFAVLLSGVGLATAHSRMESLRRRCATEIVVHDGRELGFSVAMGVASFPHTAHTQQELVAACEAALAEARRRGGNHVTLAAIRFEAS